MSMKVEIAKRRAQGVIVAPPSKSYGHRLLICAALAEGQSRLYRPGENQDILATMDCLRALGADIRTDGETVTVRGCGRHVSGGGFLPCRESGSTLRFMIPVSLLGGGGCFGGTPRLISRGVGVYEQILPSHGAYVSVSGASIRVCGSLSGGEYVIPGDVSSQFISGLMFALPLLETDSRIKIVPPFESRAYVDMTADALAGYGIELRQEKDGVYFIPGRQRYRPVDTAVEGDWSNAAFFYALNALGGNIRVQGLRSDSRQGDRICLDYLERLSRPGAQLELSDCPDLAPVLFAVAAAGNGATFTGTRRLAIKESDRAAVMAQELAKFGAHVICGEDTVQVMPTGIHAPTEPLCGHNDHRVVMALSVLATQTGAVLLGAEAVSKSYPDFFAALAGLGVSVTELT